MKRNHLAALFICGGLVLVGCSADHMGLPEVDSAAVSDKSQNAVTEQNPATEPSALRGSGSR